jgi:hypothetical protein
MQGEFQPRYRGQVVMVLKYETVLVKENLTTLTCMQARSAPGNCGMCAQSERIKRMELSLST